MQLTNPMGLAVYGFTVQTGEMTVQCFLVLSVVSVFATSVVDCGTGVCQCSNIHTRTVPALIY